VRTRGRWHAPLNWGKTQRALRAEIVCSPSIAVDAATLLTYAQPNREMIGRGKKHALTQHPERGASTAFAQGARTRRKK
jgi:hypothetical protein